MPFPIHRNLRVCIYIVHTMLQGVQTKPKTHIHDDDTVLVNFMISELSTRL